MNPVRSTFLSALAATMLAAVPAVSDAATVFRCAQPNGSVLYTDVPCAGGGPIEIHPGKADPAAAARLARAQASLDAAAAQRTSDLAREAAQRDQSAQMQGGAASSAAAAPSSGGADGYDYYGLGYGYGYGYAPGYSGGARPRPPRPRPPLPPPEKRVVPARSKNLPTISVPGLPDVPRIHR